MQEKICKAKIRDFDYSFTHREQFEMLQRMFNGIKVVKCRRYWYATNMTVWFIPNQWAKGADDAK